jgi:hypothetical protein
VVRRGVASRRRSTAGRARRARRGRARRRPRRLISRARAAASCARLPAASREPETRATRGFPEKRLKGLEPSTFCMASRRSSQLSYSRTRGEYSPAGGDGRRAGTPRRHGGSGARAATLRTPHGAVAEWLRSGLQSRSHRFDSGRRLSPPRRPPAAVPRYGPTAPRPAARRARPGTCPPSAPPSSARAPRRRGTRRAARRRSPRAARSRG